MLKLTKMNTLSAVALAMAVIATPSLAAANGYQNTAYENCKRSDTESQVLGGVLGAVAGGVFGSQVAGNGARSEGSALGAVLGAVAGSQIANKDCRSNTAYRDDGYRSTAPVYSSNGYNNTGHSSNGYNTVYTSPRVTTVHRTVNQPTYRDDHSNRGYSNNGYRDNGRFNGGYNQLAALDREIYQTRRQLKELRQRSRYNNSRRLDRRMDRLGERLRDLKNQRKYIKKSRNYH